MADVVANRAKGAVAELVRGDNTKLGVLVLKAAEADGTIVNYNSVADMLTEAGNTEADFTNYARKTAITGTLTQDDTANVVQIDIPDQTFTAAGGGANNTTAKFVVYYEVAAADSTRIPLTYHDFVATTDGNDLVAQIHADGFYEAA